MPREPSGQLITPQGTCRLRRVADLMDANGAWRLDLLQQHFLPVDVDAITRIRTSPRVPDDVIAWAPEKSGVFSVRLAYRFAMDERERPSASASSRASDGRRAIWKTIWGALLPLRYACLLGVWSQIHSPLGLINSLELWNQMICALCVVWNARMDNMLCADVHVGRNYGEPWQLIGLSHTSRRCVIRGLNGCSAYWTSCQKSPALCC